MKLPNRYGSVTKLSGNRRRPWIIKEGVSGRQKTIGYAATKEEALNMLARYNQSPWDIETDKITLQELFDLWLEKRAVKLGSSRRAGLRSAYNYCVKLSSMKYKEIKAFHMQDVIDTCGKSPGTQAMIKNLWVHLDKFAMELDIIQKRYSDLLTSESIQEATKQIFTDEEVNRLWDNKNFPWVDSVLFLLYTGFRISEMVGLKTENVDLENEIMTGGVKTAAGKNRIVPIHSKILDIVKNRYSQSKDGYLFEWEGKHLPVHKYREFWAKIMNTLKMNHTPHECRHTFRSRLDSAGANKVCIDRIMGHKSNDTGERVYTHKKIEELKLNIEKITN